MLLQSLGGYVLGRNRVGKFAGGGQMDVYGVFLGVRECGDCEFLTWGDECVLMT